MRNFLIFFSAFLIFAFLNFYFFSSSTIKSIKVGNTLLNKIEIADTQAKQEQGLSGRASIDPNFAMVFTFDKPGYYAFWMKDMNFAIDMIWTDKGGKVVGLAENALPNSYPKAFYPASPANYVLEVQAGIAEKEGLKLGSRLIFSDSTLQ